MFALSLLLRETGLHYGSFVVFNLFSGSKQALIASFPDLTYLVFKTEKYFSFTGRKVIPGATAIAFSFFAINLRLK